MTTQELNHLRDWIGRSEAIEERAAAQMVHGLYALLDRSDVPKDGDPIPPMAHWCLFKPRVPASQLGPDRHPARAGFLPPVPLPRRDIVGALTTSIQPRTAKTTVG